MESVKRRNSSISGEGRSPKRQRLGSFSPASPPIIADSKDQPEHSQPQTPPPSVRMSPSWSQPSQLLPGLGYQGPTPPNTASSQGVQSQALSNGGSSAGEAEQQTQTPATTVGEAEMREPGGDESGDVAMSDVEHRRSDHERKDESGVGVLYKLSTKPVPPAQPPLSTDLLAMYSLKTLQSSVARRDPVTGEKINVMRKSYANKLRDLGLEGRNKVTPIDPPTLSELVHYEWDDPADGFTDGTTRWQMRKGDLMLKESDMNGMLGMLDSVLSGLKEGHLPKSEHEQWKGLLGLDETPTAAATGTAKPLPHPSASVPPSAGSKIGTPNPAFLAKNAAIATLQNSRPTSPRNANGIGPAARPDRAGKKRRYDEGSWEGYDDDGYDTGSVDDSGRRGSGGGAGKRQKRKDFSANSPPFNNPANSAVGVRIS